MTLTSAPAPSRLPRAVPATEACATLTLHAGEPVRALPCPRGRCAVLEVLSGRAWITRHGCGDDVFLGAGQRLVLAGPARLYAGADGPQPLRLRWVLERGGRRAVTPVPGAASGLAA
ncbi:DUF2917 domain-containing protein [Paracidovorax konjaci]|uniref:DUF2917 domain-containing protein n=1 Tax=Paracidovorax konjaci TaxID=32040 RepID=A0A1I1RG39_9BURK|nr:DUF2917 domain-containing protein [Paracidovorax konjaci]SFD33314.1 Protein of unknown function [Paracidovorax konjaci]